jgi:hypothetical protein
MGRRSNDENSSFDMLLDTICNTFGGVVFIALMLAIFTQSEEVDDQTRRTTEQARLRRVELDSRMATAAASLSILESAMRSGLPDVSGASRSTSLLATNVLLRGLTQQLAKEQHDLEEMLTSLADSVAGILAETQSIQTRERDVITETMSLGPTSVSPRRLPRIQPIKGFAQVFVMLQDGLLYVASDVSHPLSQNGRAYDTRVVHVEKEPGLTVLTPRVDAGQQVGPGCEQTGALASLLRNADPRAECCYIYVDKRSFGAFNYVKQVLIDAGFRYYWDHSAGPLALGETDRLNAM